MPLALRKYIDATPEIQRLILDMEDEIPRRTRVFGRPFEKLKEQWLGAPPGAGAASLDDETGPYDADGSDSDNSASGDSRPRGFLGRFLDFCIRRAKWIYIAAGAALIYGIVYAMVFAGQ